MATGIQTSNGKAFEYACVIALCEQLDYGQEIIVVQSPQMDTAKRLYEEMDDEMKSSVHSISECRGSVI